MAFYSGFKVQKYKIFKIKMREDCRGLLAELDQILNKVNQINAPKQDSRSSTHLKVSPGLNKETKFMKTYDFNRKLSNN